MHRRPHAPLFSAIALLVALATVGACGPGGSPSGPTGTLAGRAMAGPTCPVVSVSPDPACADRPVVGAGVVVTDATGREVARTTTAADGGFTLELPAGRYGVRGEPVEGILGTPSVPVEVDVVAGERTAEVLLAYDTGIR